jgi:hypothetical protein
MPRFSDKVHEEFPLDPTRELYWCQCPWCPGVVLWGFRKDRPAAQGRGGTSLVHTNLLVQTGEKSMVLATATGGCERFTELAAMDPAELLHLLANAGAKMSKNTAN